MFLQISNLFKKKLWIVVLSVILFVFSGVSLAADAPKADAKAVQSGDNNFITAVEKVAETVGPTVVAIRTERTERINRGYAYSPFDDELFQRFFEDFFGQQYTQEYKRAGLGSGVIIDPRGYILTNQHVIDGADKILVRLADGREAEGKLTGSAPRNDLAVIKIDLPNLPVAKLGNSDNLKTGQWVVAIGNPFGYLLNNPEPTVTTGVISGVKRSLPRTSQRDIELTDLIQTDAAINPGNSGGPLVNLSGEIIGINAAIFSTSGGYQGMGFAIPSNSASRILNQLIKGEKITYGWIGVSIQNIDRRLADYFGLNNNLTGALIMGVLPNGPSDKAGLKNGDIILKVDNAPVHDTAALITTIGNMPAGKKLTLQILRNEKEIPFNVTVAPRPDFDENGQIIEEQSPEPPTSDESNSSPVMDNWRGLKVRDLMPSDYPKPNSDEIKGAIVSEILPNSLAEETGLKRGDIIVSMNQLPIARAQDFYAKAAKVKGDCLVQTPRGYFVIKAK